MFSEEEKFEKGCTMYLNKKGYSDDIEEYQRLRKNMIKENTPENRIAYRTKVAELNSILQKEIAKAQAIGNTEDETNLIVSELSLDEKKHEAFENVFGEKVRKGWTPDEENRLKLAQTNFDMRPTIENAQVLLEAQFRGDMAGELSREESQKANDRLADVISGMKKTVVADAETLEQRKERFEAEAQERKHREEEIKRKIDGDPRLGRPSKNSLSAREQEECNKKIRRATMEDMGDIYSL
ncbi:MAG: hypothetical protein PHY73_02030 [Candidatus Omnitrophica bacterium]|nr:hypothetical protein [Candidatus Omnitrophota bacterium]